MTARDPYIESTRRELHFRWAPAVGAALLIGGAGIALAGRSGRHKPAGPTAAPAPRVWRTSAPRGVLAVASGGGPAANLRRALVAAGGIEAHVRRGDRVVLHLPNSVDLVTGIYGTLKAGGVFVPVNSTIKPEKLAYILGNFGARSCITTVRGAEWLQPLRSELPELRSVIVASGSATEHLPPNGVGIEDLLGDSPDVRPAPGSIDLDLACLIYTSGSTGEPKGVMSDHSNVTFAIQSITSYLENRQEDIVIGVLPLSFDYGLRAKADGRPRQDDPCAPRVRARSQPHGGLLLT